MDGAINTADETVSIHHFGSNWRPENIRIGMKRRQYIFKKFPRPIAELLAVPTTFWSDMKAQGLGAAFKHLFSK